MVSNNNRPDGHGWHDAFEYQGWDIGLAIAWDGRTYLGGFVATKGLFRCSEFSMDGHSTAKEALQEMRKRAIEAVDAAIAANLGGS